LILDELMNMMIALSYFNVFAKIEQVLSYLLFANAMNDMIDEFDLVL
jgi:hypothetical protein